MPTQLTRPPYVLAHPGDTAGCGHHRIVKPLECLGALGVMFGRADLGFLTEQALRALDPDVVVWQRQTEDNQIEAMKSYRRILPQAFFVYELDDALSSVPEKSWHHPFMRKNIDERLALAIALCDVVTVTTPELVQYIKKIAGEQTQVRVVPNLLSRMDMQQAMAVRQTLPMKPRNKFRIGWGGGIGHIGDMEIMHQAMIDLKDEVEWVFVGMDPELPAGVVKEFKGGCLPKEYISVLATLDIDLMIAPLEMNHFNECKSNLRLLEAGACGFAVLATPIAPYLQDSPPVDYAKEGEWTGKIREIMALDPRERGFRGEKLRRWVERNFLFEEKYKERVQGWLPDTYTPWTATPSASKGKPIVVCAGAPPEGVTAEQFDILPNIADIGDRRGDVVIIRPNTNVTAAQIKKLLLQKLPKQATVSLLSNDGGPCSFPRSQQFIQIDKVSADIIDGICAEEPEYIDTASSVGPVVVLRREAIDACGLPDAIGSKHQELAIVEWSVMAASRGFKNACFAGMFVNVNQGNMFPADLAHQVAQRISLRWPQQKTDEAHISRVKERLEIAFYGKTYVQLPPANHQDYGLWGTVHDTPGPQTLNAMANWLSQEGMPVVKLVSYGFDEEFGELDGDADYYIFAPKTAYLSDEATGIFLAAALKNPDALVLYADHDYLDKDNKRQGHDFKPNFDLHLLMSRDYLTQCVMVKKELLEGTENAQGLIPVVLYDIFLELALRNRSRIHHVPRVLAHLALPKTEDHSKLARLKAISATTKLDGVSVTSHPAGFGLHLISYEPTVEQKVTIIIPTKNKVEMLQPCLETVLKMTTYENFEVLIVDNGSDRPEMLEYLSRITDKRVRIVQWPDAYNWSKLNNQAVKLIAPDTIFYCFLNDDTRVMNPKWLSEMVGAAQFRGVAAVGARLDYPHGVIQHIGVVAHKGINGHIHKGVPANSPGYQGIAILSHEATAVTGACMLVSAAIFDEIGGFNEEWAHNFNDVIFCLEARKRGYVNVIANQATLQHYEGVTRVTAATDEGRQILIEEGKRLGAKYGEPDPYWNPNLMVTSLHDGMMSVGLNYDLLNWMDGAERPWAIKLEGKALFVGSVNYSMPERQDKMPLYEVQAAGFQARIVNPIMENVRGFDLREHEDAKKLLVGLGVDRIIVTSLAESGIGILPWLLKMELPILYRPVDLECMCPQKNLNPRGGECNDGWKTNGCQACVDKCGSPNGYVATLAWDLEWARFFSSPLVTWDFSMLAPQFQEVLNSKYKVSGDAIIRAA